jgi:dTDP-4-dehydrorhamnose 3,5-epimerase
MKFLETELNGAFIIKFEKHEDERGFFTRVWDKKLFQENGLNSDLLQISFSFSKKRGTLRGMHLQKKPFEESKLVRCTNGKIFDVIIDLRQKSSTYKKWISMELSSDNLQGLYIPEGFAHGFQTLEDNCEVCYHISNWFSPEHARGIRWDDEEFNITWPINNPIISKKDLSYEKEEYIV